MKTIKEVAQEYVTNSSGYSPYFGQGEFRTQAFIAGVEFAQRWIPIEEELPSENVTVLAKGERGPEKHVWISVISKNRLVGLHSVEYGSIEASHWRQIERK